MKTTMRFKCPYEDCGEWIITTMGNVCSLQGFYCLFCKRQIHPSMVFGGRFGSGTLDYEKEFLAYIGSHVVDLDDMAQENTALVQSGTMSVAQAQAEIWGGVERVFRLVRIFKGYNYESREPNDDDDSTSDDSAYRECCYCGGA